MDVDVSMLTDRDLELLSASHARAYLGDEIHTPRLVAFAWAQCLAMQEEIERRAELLEHARAEMREDDDHDGTGTQVVDGTPMDARYAAEDAATDDPELRKALEDRRKALGLE